MLTFINDPLYRFRIVALIEGLSFLLLLFVSMPLKYYLGYATFSWYVGMAHGVLFILYVVLAIEILIRRKITFWQFLRVLIASIVPFGTFFNERMLKNRQLSMAS